MDTSIPQDDTPIKRCSKCKQELPATPEYFFRCAKHLDGLQSSCKACRHNELLRAKEQNPNFYKERYQKYYPRTPENLEARRDRDAQNMRTLRERRRHPGVCSICLTNPVDPGRLCDKCYAYQKQYGERNREVLRHNQNRLKAKLRREVLAAYGGKCVCCGESHPEFLAIDHVNNDGASTAVLLSTSIVGCAEMDTLKKGFNFFVTIATMLNMRMAFALINNLLLKLSCTIKSSLHSTAGALNCL